jgi:aerobic carbon-monoxide dehydrogenase medium subunit
MKPAVFIYEKPDNIESILAMLAETQIDSKIIAGGQSLVPMMNFRMARPERLIDINAVKDLDYIKINDAHLVIGALARHNEIKDHPLVKQHAPLMSEAYEWVAHGPIRNRGTLCGNLCHNDPASEMPALMLIQNAVMVVRSATSERTILAQDFFLGIYTTALEPQEMLVEVRIPIQHGNISWGFQEVSLRKGDFAMVLAAALVKVENGKFTSIALAAAGISDSAVRLTALEAMLLGQPATQESVFAVVAEGLQSVDVTNTPQISESYRRNLLQTLTSRAIHDACIRHI